MRPVGIVIPVLAAIAACQSSGSSIDTEMVDTPTAERGYGETTATAVTDAPGDGGIGDADIGKASGETALVGEAIDAQLARLRGGRVVGARLISGRTLSCKLWFADGGRAVFKPILKNDRRPLHEVAAFRLARLLGVERMPLSTIGKLPLNSLIRLIEKRNPEEAERLATSARLDDRGFVAGALISWMDGLDADRFQALGGLERHLKQLSQSETEEKASALAGALSRLLVFDYITGNWDRFSGGNVFVGQGDAHFVLIDHNSAFARWSERQQKRMDGYLSRTERFSRHQMKDIETLARQTIIREMEAEPWHAREPLLSDIEIDLLLIRRDQIKMHVERLTGIHGQQAVLVFP